MKSLILSHEISQAFSEVGDSEYTPCIIWQCVSNIFDTSQSTVYEAVTIYCYLSATLILLAYTQKVIVDSLSGFMCHDG